MWSVVVFGDDVRLPGTEGSTASQIIGGASSQPRRTLFQDIFGKSAFTDVLNEHPSSSASVEDVRPWSGKEAKGIFDAPAYLMPPIESVFSELMAGFLTTKPDEPDVNVGSDEVVEDVEMALEPPAAVKSRPERVVDEKEMELFTELFKNHAVKATQVNGTQPHVHVNGNGLHKANGNHHPPALLSPTKANGFAAHSPISLDSMDSSPPSSRSPSPPPTTGKKRKIPLD